MTTINGNASEITSLTVNENIYVRLHKCFVQPIFGEYQLLGDSMLMHFSDRILHQPYKVENGFRGIGYCISGQKIIQLRQRIKQRAYPLSSKLMIMIGTNDVLCGENIDTMKKHFKSLLDLIIKTSEKVLILTLPPIPKLCVTFYHWTLIREYNDFLKKFHDGKCILVADICPLFTKFKGALEYDISIVKEPICESYDKTESRISDSKGRRKHLSEKNKSGEKVRVAADESDYRNTTESNQCSESEILSSELSQEKQFGMDDYQDIRETPMKPKAEKVQGPHRLVVRTLEDVFGKDKLIRKKVHVQKSLGTEKRLRKAILEEVIATDSWIAETDEDSMEGHVYKSQEEIEYDLSDVSCEKKKNAAFLRYIESINDKEDTLKRNISVKTWKRNPSRNEFQDTSESSSSSNEIESPKKRMYPFVDRDFRQFLESYPSAHACDSGIGSPNISGSRVWFSTRKMFHGFHNVEKLEGVSERYRLIIELANRICHMEYFEVFYRYGKNRINMIHFSNRGLNKLKNYLISNKYVVV